MLNQPSSLSQIVYRVGDTLKAEYDIDPVPFYEKVGVDPSGPGEAGARQPNSVVTQMFELAGQASGDPAFGLRVGLSSKPRHFYVIGHAWMASSTLVEAIEKLLRYETIFNSGDTELSFRKQGDLYLLSEGYPNPADYPGKLRVDNGIASVLRLCQYARGDSVDPVRLDIFAPYKAPVDIYESLIRGPVRVHGSHNVLYFKAEDLEQKLPGAIPELVDATCRIADNYLASLDSSRIAHQVRAELVQLLPGGAVDQEKIAAKLYRSASTLQRQLHAEGTSYRDVLDQTRRELAEAYLRDGRHSQTETAFLVGFSDQSNFARAFRRWTGMSPGQFQKSVA